ncbi:MAG: hypothetical protein ACREIA_00400 [Opitutaceae bacterium]
MNGTREFRYRWRFDAKPLVRDAMRILHDTEVARVLSDIDSHEWSDEIRKDISDASFDEVAAQLDAAGVSRDQGVYVFWQRPVPAIGVAITFGQFRDNWDDFWYPSSDDAMLVDESMSALIRFDHEERLAISRRT